MIKKINVGILLTTLVVSVNSANAHGTLTANGQINYAHTHISGAYAWQAPDAHGYSGSNCGSPCDGYLYEKPYIPLYYSPDSYSSYNGYSYPSTTYSAVSPSYAPPVHAPSYSHSNTGTLVDPFVGMPQTQGCAGCEQKLQETVTRLLSTSRRAHHQENEFNKLKITYNNLLFKYQQVTSQASLN